MNLRQGPDHKICGMWLSRSPGADLGAGAGFRRAQESGYALVALLALMTLLALFALAAAPSVRQQLQREREKEAIFRGEQVADAIRAFYIYRANTQGTASEQALPNSIDQLLEGIPVPGGSKKRQILRPSAARDPLSSSGEWRLIRPRAPELIDFQQSVLLYAGNFVPPPTDRQLLALQQLAVPQLAGVLNTGTSEPASSGEASADTYSGPFVGVVSHSRNNSILHFYDIDRHDKWIFTPLFR
jgi:type II secretory pathway pseudopilin PulG